MDGGGDGVLVEEWRDPELLAVQCIFVERLAALVVLMVVLIYFPPTLKTRCSAHVAEGCGWHRLTTRGIQ